MCFNQPTSFIFAGIGLLSTWYCYKQTKNFRLTAGVFYFFLMELLQAFQYFWIDQCDTNINKVLTIVGFIHICFQPYMTHYMISGLSNHVKGKAVYFFLLRLCFIAAIALFLRWPLSYVPYFQSPEVMTKGFLPGPHPEGMMRGEDTEFGRSPEWIRGNEVCTFSGRKHLGWSIPLAANSYHVPGIFVHFFVMFAPFFAMKQNMWVYGVFLMLGGPILGRFITSDLMEQASIWCFFSVFQVIAMVFAIKFFLHTNYQKISLKKLKEKKKEEKEE